MAHPFLGKKNLIITAHPDDESFLMGGTLYKNAANGGKNILVCATLGEEGTAYLSHTMSRETLTHTRKKELTRASKFLHIARLYLLNLPDSCLHRANFNSLFYKRTIAVAEKHEPDVIMSFGEYGMSGHRDHIAAGKVAKRIANRFDIPLFTVTSLPSLIKDFKKRIKSVQRGPFYTKKEPIFEMSTIKIAVNPRMKLRAIQYHKSQLGGKPPFSALSPRMRQKRLRAEYFARSK